MSKINRKTYLLIGGTVLIAGAGLAYALRKNAQDSKSDFADSKLDRQTVIQILKELRKEMYSVFTNYSMVSMQIKQQTMGKARPEEVKMMLLEQPMFKSEIDSVEETVYNMFGVSREAFQHVCEHEYANDLEIRALQQDMKDSFDKSFQGIAPDSKTDIPEFLTPEVAYEILSQVMLQSTLRLNQKLIEFKESGEEVSFNNPKLMQVVQSLKMDNSKKEIMAQYGLDKFEEPPQKILQYATQQYTISNKNGFAEKMNGLDMKYQQTMEQLLMNGPMTEMQLKASMTQEFTGSQPFAGMGGLRMRKGPSQQEVEPQLRQSSSSQNAGSEKEVPQEEEKQINQNSQEEQKPEPEVHQEVHQQVKEPHQEVKEVHQEVKEVHQEVHQDAPQQQVQAEVKKEAEQAHHEQDQQQQQQRHEQNHEQTGEHHAPENKPENGNQQH